MTVKIFLKSALFACAALAGGFVRAQQPIISDNAQIQNPNPGDAVKSDWKPSLVRDGVIDRVPHVTKVIPWAPIRENDVLWKKRVWREIDIREKQNAAFRFPGDENTGGGYFIEILMDAVKRGKIKAYSPYDDRFVGALTKEQIMETLTGKPDTTESEDPITHEMKQVITNREFDPELVMKYRMKEDWIMDRNTGRMVVRIIGIAPVMDLTDPVTGAFKATKPLFWLYYPEIRETMAQYEVFNPENDMARMTWDEYFEGRWFSSRITKVSNNFDQRIDQNSSSMEALYQAQRFSEEIFNKEHDMWVY